MIEIKKSDDGYLVRATPPHVRTEWESTGPVSVDVLISELRSRGADQTDIGDALYTANPDWLRNR